MSGPKKKSETDTEPKAGKGLMASIREYRRELTFVGLFLVILSVSFTILSLQQVNDGFVEPFTGGVAAASGVALKLLGQDITKTGTIIALNDRQFAVNIRNGCNGIETMVIFLAAVLAFPAPWKARIIGLVFGSIAIQAINLVRVVALFFTGAYFPKFFDSSHTVVWQTIVIAFGVFLWIFWADRLAMPKQTQKADDEPPKSEPEPAGAT
ncbi:MAG: exosortase H [Thermoanaerobaculia bacterium]|nr:exosortase H [Thermoanaerobaculia bacterium]